MPRGTQVHFRKEQYITIKMILSTPSVYKGLTETLRIHITKLFHIVFSKKSPEHNTTLGFGCGFGIHPITILPYACSQQLLILMLLEAVSKLSQIPRTAEGLFKGTTTVFL